MKNHTIKYIGLDVHKETIVIAIADDARYPVVSFNAFFKAFFNNQCGADQPGHDRDSKA